MFSSYEDSLHFDLTRSISKPLQVDLFLPDKDGTLYDDIEVTQRHTLYRSESSWWHLSRREASVASASLIVGAPVTIACLISPWLAKAFLPFTFTALCIGIIETLIHFVRVLRSKTRERLGCAIAAMGASLAGHALMLLISCLRGLHATTPVTFCAFFSTGAYVVGFGLMLIVDEWWYAITPAQMLLFLSTLHAMGLLLIISL